MSLWNVLSKGQFTRFVLGTFSLRTFSLCIYLRMSDDLQGLEDEAVDGGHLG